MSKSPTMPPDRSLPQDVLRRLTGGARGSVLDVLRDVTTEPREIEGFRPLSEALEWRLANVYWALEGAIPFVRNDVPYLVNNTGRLSENAAALVVAAFEELRSRLPDRLTILELGAGTGLHARYFLDALLEKCREAGTDYYDRLLYVASDRFERTVLGWRENGLFAGHEDHVLLCVCDAEAPRELHMPGGGAAPLPELPMVVFCNYVLDVLPSGIVRRAPAGLERLCVRTHLAGGAASLALAGLASLDEAEALAASGRFEDLARILPLLPQLDLETDFRPWTPATEAEAVLAAGITGEGRTIVNPGALGCLEQVMNTLHPCGFILVNDYGPVRSEDVMRHIAVQRFGGSVALGINFPLLEHVLAARGLTVLAPEADDQRRVHTRLIARSVERGTEATLRSQFSAESDRYRDAPLDEARGHVAAGRATEAVASYRTLIERNPHDWQMLGEAAEYIGLQLRDFDAGLELAHAALERNPWCSAWLWNVLGDCLFYKERLDDAHDAFVEAQRIDPDDPRTNLNLAYTLSARGAQGNALAAIARGLAQDGKGRAAYRSRLLEKQGHILTILSEHAAGAQARLIQRTERFR